MSKCISMHGEYSEHALDADFVCDLCWSLDGDALIADRNEWRRRAEAAEAEVAELNHQIDIETKHDNLPDGGVCDVCTHLSIEQALNDADAAEAAVDRVRSYAAYLDTLAPGDRHYAAGIREALDGKP